MYQPVTTACGALVTYSKAIKAITKISIISAAACGALVTYSKAIKAITKISIISTAACGALF